MFCNAWLQGDEIKPYKTGQNKKKNNARNFNISRLILKNISLMNSLIIQRQNVSQLFDRTAKNGLDEKKSTVKNPHSEKVFSKKSLSNLR